MLAQRFTLLFQETRKNSISKNEIEILLVEDNSNDVELKLISLNKNNLADKVRVIENGVVAMNYILCTGAYAGLNIHEASEVILPDLGFPEPDKLEVSRKIKSDERTKIIAVVTMVS